jgi:hypothetical protein
MVLIWLDRRGFEHSMPVELLPPTRTALHWQQVYEYGLGYPAWLKR